MIRIGQTLALAAAMCFATTAHAGLLGFYSFDAGTAVDLSGNGNHGTLGGGVAAPTFTASGFEGGAFNFDGNDFIDLPININFSNLPNLTMGAWVNADLLGTRETILSHDTGSFDRTLTMDDRGSAAGYSAFTGTGVGFGGTATVGLWTFVAVVYDGTTVTVDVGGTRTSYTDNTDLDVGETFTRVGQNPGFLLETFNGSIDNVFFYDMALSGAQLDAIRRGGAAAIVPEPGSLSLFGLSALALIWMRRKRG